MKKLAILCVDDEHIVLNSLKDELAGYFGASVIIETAESGEEALEVLTFLKKRNLPLALIISDYVMPFMKGDELLEVFHRESPGTVKILLTGEASLEGVTNAVNKANLYRYIPKPWETKDLAMTVTAAIESFSKDKQLEEQNQQLRQLNQSLEMKVEERIQEIHKKNKQIEASIRYAQRIQQAILPPERVIASVFPKHFILYRPRDVVSGDFYWFSEKNGKAVLVAADCTGHGVPGAFMSLIGESLLGKTVHDMGVLAPDQILSKLNEGIANVWKQDKSMMREGMDIAVCVIDKANRTVEFAGAKNPLVVVDKGETTVIKGDKASLDGNLDNEYTAHLLHLDTGAHFYMYSDGFQDQFGGEENKKFTSRKFRELLSSIHKQPIAAQRLALEQVFERWRGNHPQIDDLLVVGVEIDW